MPPQSNAERQARYRERQADALRLMKQQISDLEQWVNELQEQNGLPVRHLPEEPAPDGT